MTLKPIHPRSSQLLLLDRPHITFDQWPVVTMFLSSTILDNTTFTVNVTACDDLENSFIFDNVV